MKIGFSSLVCPNWDLPTIIEQAAALGFHGFELRGLQGELHLPLSPQLSRNPRQVAAQCKEKNVELVCLGSSVTLDSKDKKKVAEQKGILGEYMELAAELGCPYVRMFAGEIQKWDNKRAAMARIAEALISLVPLAQKHGVTVLVENGGDFAASEDMWFLIDAVTSPSVRVCWNICNARMGLERPTLSFPRLGTKVGLVHLADAQFDPSGALMEYKPLGQGNADVSRALEILRGLAYQHYVMFEWPKLWVPNLPDPGVALPEAAKFLKAALTAKQPILSAYKGDKNAPKYPAKVVASA